MPDWSYQTLFRPILFRMQPRIAQRLAIGSLGRLGRFALGRQIIELLGHMQPDERLAFKQHDIRFPSRVGLCAGLDSQGVAARALDKFGFAFLEYGPLTTDGCSDSPIDFQPAAETIRLESPEQNPGIQFAHQSQQLEIATPLFLRFDSSVDAKQISELVVAAPRGVGGFVVPWQKLLELQDDLARSGGVENSSPSILALISSEVAGDAEITIQSLSRQQLVNGVLIDGSLSSRDGRRVFSQDIFEATCLATSRWRECLGDDCLVIAAGGLHEPAQALRLIRAGAHIVGVDSGMVFAGPGLAKRSNELLAQLEFPPTESTAAQRPARESWFWALLMGLSMLGGGVLALVIALTRVVLPYDESVVGMTRDQLLFVNDRLLDFMAHDRVTLAGTMLSVGTLYTGLSCWGARCGAHWAQQAIIWSALVGFFTFFLFLGFGYFDPFHAFVTCILFQFLLLTIYARLSPRSGPVRVDPVNDLKWKRALWGQLMFIILGAALIVAGLVISKIGISSVFVKEDLEFLCTTPDKLFTENPQLLSLVAHDRATFGGMLISSGMAVLLSALWGFRRGHAWLWWSLLIGGCFGFLCTIGIHMKVGYTSLKHLLPAYGGLIWLIVAATLCFGYLHDCVTRLNSKRES